MLVRTALAAIDHNQNTGRDQVVCACVTKICYLLHQLCFVLQRVSSDGQLVWDLVKTRHGKKHFVKAVKVAKDYGWRTSLASLTVKVADIPF